MTGTSGKGRGLRLLLAGGHAIAQCLRGSGSLTQNAPKASAAQDDAFRRLSADVQASGRLFAGVHPSRGRGLYARRAIRTGDVLFDRAAPLASYPAANARCCYHCLRSVPHTSARFCSPSCEQEATREYYGLEQTCPGVDAFVERCTAAGQRFPLVALRLALRVATGSTDSGTLDPLCFVKLPGGAMPDAWADDHGRLRDALSPAGASCGFLTPEWYAGVLGRLHLNSFRVETLDSAVLAENLGALAAAAVGGGCGGTAVFLGPSLFNHSCVPTVGVAWDDGARASFVASTDMAEGDEATISYVDCGATTEARRRELRFGYGFECGCELCRESDDKGNE